MLDNDRKNEEEKRKRRATQKSCGVVKSLSVAQHKKSSHNEFKGEVDEEGSKETKGDAQIEQIQKVLKGYQITIFKEACKKLHIK